MVVFKWSACSPSTPTIRVRITPKSKVVFGGLFENNKNVQKETEVEPFKNTQRLEALFLGLETKYVSTLWNQ